MQKYSQWELDNGLQVIFLPTPGRTLATVNILYNVGARDEEADHTGFAHLFEHLMFSGSKHIPSYDNVVENAGGKNNAYTNNDFTNYYITLPLANLETGLWLESDRMQWLNINEESLNVQRGVVVEEFKERCFNAPFGLLWHHCRELMYKKHPYRWPTIGLNFEHIEKSKLATVEAFYHKFYNPNNAILGIAADIELDSVKLLVNKWFAELKNANEPNKNDYEMETEVMEHVVAKHSDLGANKSIILFWRHGGQLTDETLALYVFSNILGETNGGYIIENCVKKTGVFSSASIFTSDSFDYSCTMLYGVLNPGNDYEKGREILLNTLNEAIENEVIKQDDLEAYKHSYLYNEAIQELKPSYLIENLCIAQVMGGAHLVESEKERVMNLELSTLNTFAKQILNPENMGEIHYSPKNT